MKKLFLASALALFGVVSAQESNGFEGKLFLKGAVNYSTTSRPTATIDYLDYNDVKTNEFTIAPAVGVFVAPTVAVGLGLTYTSAETKGYQKNVVLVDKIATEFKANSFGFMPFIRKYWAIGNNLYLFGQLETNFNFGKNVVTSPTTVIGTKVESTTQKTSDFGVHVRPGLDYFLTNNWTVEATVGSFGYSSYKIGDGKANTAVDLGVSFADINLGVKYVF